MPFDYRVDHINSQGKVTHRTPYRMVIDQEHGKRMERPPGSGLWYNEDGTLLKDESAAIKAQQAISQAKQQELSEQKAAEAREKLKAELRAEILAEQKGTSHGPGRKV
jgi:hypothetical protein